MSIERLTAEDQIMLWPDEVWPQDIGALAILDDGLLSRDGSFDIEAVREAVAARLHLVPRFRQLLYVPPPRLGGPLWVDAPAFDIGDHVHVAPLPAPGDESQLLLAMEQIRRRRLDRSRPLWEMWFLTGLADGGVGLFLRMHHTIADGIAGVATFGALLDVTADASSPPTQPWTPTPSPTAGDLRADRLRRYASAPGRALSMLVHPLSTLEKLIRAWPATRELVAEQPLPATSLDQVVGPGRGFALIRSRLDLFKEIAHAHEATVNDVLLAVIANGLRHLLSQRGESVEDVVLRVYVPVTRRQGQFDRARGNQIAQMVVPLPIGVSDPELRLRQIAAETTKRKARSRPSLGKMPHRGALGRALLKLIDRQRVNVTTADVPGPDIPLYLAGARLLEVFPVLPLIGKVSLGIGAMSYSGEFNITVVADRDALPDLEVFVAGAKEELEALTPGVATRTGNPI